MSKEDKEIKTMVLDLAKVISYLSELQKTNSQNYITPEGLAFLEGVVLAGNDKVRVVPKSLHEEFKSKTIELLKQRQKPAKRFWFL